MRNYDQIDLDDAEFIDLGVASEETEGCPNQDLEANSTQSSPVGGGC